MDARLGLKQIPTGPARVRGGTKGPPKRRGDVWGTGTIVNKHATVPRVECKSCGKVFCGGVTRIEEHITGQGVISACPCDTDTFLDLKHKLMDKSDASASKKRQKEGEAAVEAAAEAKPVVKSEVKQEFKQQDIYRSLNSASSAEVASCRSRRALCLSARSVARRFSWLRFRLRRLRAVTAVTLRIPYLGLRMACVLIRNTCFSIFFNTWNTYSPCR